MDSPSYNKGEEETAVEDVGEQDKERRQEPGEPMQEEAEETRAPRPQDQEIKRVKPHQEQAGQETCIAIIVGRQIIGRMYAQTSLQSSKPSCTCT